MVKHYNSVLVVLFIATPLQNTCHISVTNLPHLHNLQLAHPITAEREFKISLLITIGILLVTMLLEVMDLRHWIPNQDTCYQGRYNQHHNLLQPVLWWSWIRVMILVWNVFGTCSLLECLPLMKQQRTTCYNNTSIPVWHVMTTVPMLQDFLGNEPTLSFQQTYQLLNAEHAI